MSPKLFPELRDRHGYSVIMFPNDHLPPHVHVYHGEFVTRVSFEKANLEIMDSSGFRQRDLNELCKLLQPYRERLIELWNIMHPDIPFHESEDGENE